MTMDFPHGDMEADSYEPSKSRAYPVPMDRWAEVSLWPAVRTDFLRWYMHARPELPERDHVSQPDPRWLLFALFMRETGGDYDDWVAKHRESS